MSRWLHVLVLSLSVWTGISNEETGSILASYILPKFTLQMEVMDEDLDLAEFRSHLESSVTDYLVNSFFSIPIFSTDEHSSEDVLESLELGCSQITRAFLGDHDLEQEQMGTPTSLIFATLEANVTWIKSHPDNVNTTKAIDLTAFQQQIRQAEAMMNTMMRLALEARQDRLLSYFRRDPLLKGVAKLQAHVEDVILDNNITDTWRTFNHTQESLAPSNQRQSVASLLTCALLLVAAISILCALMRRWTILPHRNGMKQEFAVHQSLEGDDEDGLCCSRKEIAVSETSCITTPSGVHEPYSDFVSNKISTTQLSPSLPTVIHCATQ